MVAKQLQWDDIQDPLKAVDSARNYNLAPASLLERRVVIAADDDWLPLAGGNLGEGRLDLGVERIAGHNDDYWHVLVDERERTVLEFTSEDTCRCVVLLVPITGLISERRTLRVQITNFLDLEGSLEASSILESTTHDKQRAGDLERFRGELLEGLVLVEDGSDLLREGMKTRNDLVAAFSERDTILRKLERHHNERNILRRVGLYSASSIKYWRCKWNASAHTLVLATPISGPALICTPQCVSREIVEPTVFTTPTQSAPLSRQYFNARMVSAVSPD